MTTHPHDPARLRLDLHAGPSPPDSTRWSRSRTCAPAGNRPPPGAPAWCATAGGKLTFHIFAALTEFECSMIRERTRAGLDAARARGRVGGRPRSLTDKDLEKAKTLLANPDITVEEVAARLSVAPATLYLDLVGEGRCLRRFRFEPVLLDTLYAVLASYRGHLGKANSHRLWASLWRRFAFLQEFFALDAATGKLLRKDRAPPELTSVRGQYRWLRQRFPGDMVFFQVGRFYEFYGADDALLAQRHGLEPLAENRRGARFGFPLTLARRYARVLLRDERSILVVGQTEQSWTRIRERRPLWRLVPRRGAMVGTAGGGKT